jgi:dihydroorotase
MNELTIATPDDFHVHFRGQPVRDAVVPYTALHFRRALVMPNVPWIGDWYAMVASRDRILAACAAAGVPRFEPLMTLALEDSTRPDRVREARARGAVACKLYPRGATTGAYQRGVSEPLAPGMRAVYETMRDCGLVLCIHGEVPSGPRRLREERYLPVVAEIVRDFPGLKVVLEHVSSQAGIEYVLEAPATVAATITLHHLVQTIDDAWENSHNKCNPVQKDPGDQARLWSVVRDGNPKFCFGSDSAPWLASDKHCAEAACGCFTAPGLLPRLAQAFEVEGCLERLEGFVSHHGADFYGLPRNPGRVRLIRSDRHTQVPRTVHVPDAGEAIVVWPGPPTHWRAEPLD